MNFHFLSTAVVSTALYVIYATDVPAKQDPKKNLCWRITNGKLELAQTCQVIINSILFFIIMLLKAGELLLERNHF